MKIKFFTDPQRIEIAIKNTSIPIVDLLLQDIGIQDLY